MPARVQTFARATSRTFAVRNQRCRLAIFCSAAVARSRGGVRIVLTNVDFSILELRGRDEVVARRPMPAVKGYTFSEGRFDTGKKIDYLRAVVEFALEREDLGPEFRIILSEIAKREGLG